MFKLIACDLDETLLNRDGSICERNLNAIRKTQALGVKFVPATGRGYQSVRGILKDIGTFEKEDEYVISFNGGAITENKGEKLLHFEGISFELADELWRRSLKYDVSTHVYTKDKVYACRMSQEEYDFIRGRIQIEMVSDRDLSFLKGTDIVKVIYAKPDYAYLKQIEADYADIIDEMDVSYSSNRYIEFNRRGVNKGAGLLNLAMLLGIRQKETIAIGDNYNDLSMIRAAGLGVGVANTVPEMKNQCDVITRATHEDGAVAEVIETYILNPAVR
jgi:hypothetical protein